MSMFVFIRIKVVCRFCGRAVFGPLEKIPVAPLVACDITPKIGVAPWKDWNFSIGSRCPDCFRLKRTEL